MTLHCRCTIPVLKDDIKWKYIFTALTKLEHILNSMHTMKRTCWYIKDKQLKVSYMCTLLRSRRVLLRDISWYRPQFLKTSTRHKSCVTFIYRRSTWRISSHRKTHPIPTSYTHNSNLTPVISCLCANMIFTPIIGWWHIDICLEYFTIMLFIEFGG